MKIQIVFDVVDTTPGNSNKLQFVQVTNLETGARLSDDNPVYGQWVADGDYEALNLEVLPPLDKVTLTVVEATGKPLYHLKPLAWKQYPSGHYWVARAAGQQYQILRLDDGRFRLTGTSLYETDTPKFTAFELAEAAAWEHYVAHMAEFLE